MSVAAPPIRAETIPAAALATRPSAKAPHKASGKWWVYLMLTIGLALLIGPFIWMILSSFKDSAELRSFPPTLFPQKITFLHYQDLFQKLNFPRYFFNSVVVATFVVGANLLFCSMLGYALAKLHFAGKRTILLLVLGTLMVPSTVLLVPLFVLFSNLGLVNSYPALILPFAAGPFGVFLMRQFMLGLPEELLEAARIDGAGEFRTFFTIVLPLCGAPLATLGILTFLASWNNFIWPLIVSTGENMYTLPVALGTFAIGQFRSDYGLLMAGSVVLVAPVLILYLLLQRYFQQGIATTGLKG